MKKYIKPIIIFQLIIILILIKFIYLKRQNTITTINPTKKESIATNSATSLVYYYEPAPNTKEAVNTWAPYQAEYTINSDSLNERFDYQVKAPQNTTRIITLGDSFTYGLYVDTKDNWPEKLEDLLNQSCSNNFEVINLGVYGYDIRYSLERYELRGQKYNPDIIIWMLKHDDLRQVNEVLIELEKKYQQEMRESGEFEAEVKKGNLYPSWKKAEKEAFEKYGEEYIYNQQKDYIENFYKLAPNKNIIFTTFPFTPKADKEFIKSFSYKKHSYYLELDNVQNDELFFPNDSHPNKEGHAIISNEIFEYMKNKEIITCSKNSI